MRVNITREADNRPQEMVKNYSPQGDVIIRLEGSEGRVINIRIGIQDFSRAVAHLGENVTGWVSGGRNE